MEKDNKYYSIIENIVKNHKKYNGYDAILDDIIDDVFKHSKTVMNSVKDEEVIISYLQKLVAVSIITVPKRMNFHNELKQKTLPKENENNVLQSINTQNQTENIKTDIPSFEQQKENTPKANIDFVDKMINSIDTASVLDNDTTVIKSDAENQNFFDELQEDNTVDAEQNLHEETNDIVFSRDEKEILELNLDNAIVEESAEPETVDTYTDDEPVSLASEDWLAEEQSEEPATVDTFADDEPVSLVSEDLLAEEQSEELTTVDEFTEEQSEELATVDTFAEDEPVDLASEDLLAEEQTEELTTVDEFTEDETEELATVDTFAEDEPVDLVSEDLLAEEQTEELTTVDEFTEEQSEELATVDTFADDEPVDLASEDLLAEEQSEELTTVDEFTEDETEELATVDTFADDEPVSLESEDFLTEVQSEELATVDTFADDEPVNLASEDLLAEEQSEELTTVDTFADDEPISLASDDLLAENTLDIQLQEDDSNLGIDLLSDEDNDNNSIDILSLDNDNDSQMQEFEDIEASNALDEENSLENDFNYDDDITIGLADDNSAAKEESQSEHALIDYSQFSYIPEIKDIDADLQNIETKLIDLDRQKPELNILKIFDLRYKQNLPINKIAVDLNIQKESVLLAIDEIVELI